MDESGSNLRKRKRKSTTEIQIIARITHDDTRSEIFRKPVELSVKCWWKTRMQDTDSNTESGIVCLRPVRLATTGKKAPKPEAAMIMKTEAILKWVKSWEPPPLPQLTESSDIFCVD